jgi:hypothetical protein
VKALQALTVEFRSELELHGVSVTRADAVVQSFAALLGLPPKR